MLSDALLVILNFGTSTLTGITGVGGGMILLALMPFLLPPAAIIPVHGASQLVSNASRAWFGRRHMLWAPMRPFLLGSLLGGVVFAALVARISLDYLPPLIGLYILLSLWSKAFNRLLQRFENFFLIGFIQTGLGLFVGAPGPLAISALHRRHDDNHAVVSTGALMMTIVHGLKVVVYFAAGFQLGEYWGLIAAMALTAVLGSWVGTKLRHRIQARHLKTALHWLLTALAAQLLLRHAWQAFIAHT